MKKASNFHPEFVKHQASGGFKFPLEVLTKSSKSPATFQTATFKRGSETRPPDELPTKKEVCDRIGVDSNVKEFPIDFEELEGEGVYGLNSRRDLADYLIKDIEKKLEKMKMGRNDLEKKIIEKRELRELSQPGTEDVIIYEGDQRKQYASHLLSTLEVHSVENLEALITAHRQEMAQLESHYFSKRRLSSKNKNGQSKAGRKMQKSWNRFSHFTNEKDESAFKSTKKPMTKEEYYQAYENYLQEKNRNKGKTKENLSTLMKSKLKESFDPDFDRYQPTSPNPKRAKSPPKLKPKPPQAQLQEPESPSKLEKPLVKYFFQKIPRHESHKNPTKTEILKFLIQNPKIMELYGLNDKTLNQDLNDFTHYNFMNFELFDQFLKKKRIESNEQLIENTCLLSSKELAIMRELFSEVDRHNDGVVKIEHLTDKIRNDRRLAKKLEFQAVYLPAIDQVLTLNQVLKQIEQEAMMRKGVKDYISWEEFEKYFLAQKIRGNMGLLAKIRILRAKTLISKTEGDENVLDMDRFLKETLRGIFNSTTKRVNAKGEVTGYVKTFRLLENIRGNPEYWKYEREIVRKKSGLVSFSRPNYDNLIENHNLKEENLADLLLRVENEAPEYIVWNDFIEYFTRKGKPNYVVKKEKEEGRKLQEIFMPPNIEDFEEEYQTNALLNLRSSSPRHSIDSPYKLKP